MFLSMLYINHNSCDVEKGLYMYSDHEVELWYLGRPFAEPDTGEQEASVVPLSHEEAERIFLGLPLKAA